MLSSSLLSTLGYRMHISESRLLHEAWYDENQENNSSNEEVKDKFDDDLISCGEDGSGNNNMYDSDDASE
jgi:hypothetical protein